MMYCVKCRAKREGKDAQEVTMKMVRKLQKLLLKFVAQQCSKLEVSKPTICYLDRRKVSFDLMNT